MNEAKVYVGVDVAKEYLDVAWEGERRRVSNDARGRLQLMSWLGKIKGSLQVICEASGGYERALVRALQCKAIAVSVVQASRVRQFARAAGILAKTDDIDAVVLCAFGKAMKPELTVASEEQQQHLRELDAQRRHLGKLLVMEKNRLEKLTHASVIKSTRSWSTKSNSRSTRSICSLRN